MTGKGTDFFDDEKPAAVLKHSVLAEYLQIFATAVSSRRATPVALIDAYAGPGVYANGGKGSPIIAMDVADKLAAYRTPRTLNCYFIEKNRQRATELAKNLEIHKANGRQLRVLQGAAEVMLPQVLSATANQPALTFIDPFGAGISRRLLDNLMPRPGARSSREVLINLSVHSVGRIGGLLQLPEEKRPRGWQKTIKRVDDVMGSTWWQSVFVNYRENDLLAAMEAAERIVEDLQHQLCGTHSCESISIPVRKTPESAPLFLLTLFYTHPLAGYKFADAACRGTKRYRRAFHQLAIPQNENPLQDCLIDADDQWDALFEESESELDEQMIRTVYNNLTRVLARRESVGVGDHILEILGDSLSLAGEKHIRRAWDQLAKDGVVDKRPGSDLHKLTIVRRRAAQASDPR